MLDRRLHAINDVVYVAHENDVSALAFCKQLRKLDMVRVIEVKTSLISQKVSLIVVPSFYA